MENYIGSQQHWEDAKQIAGKNEIQSKLDSIQTMLNGLYDGGDVTEAARSSLQYTLNEAQKVVKKHLRKTSAKH